MKNLKIVAFSLLALCTAGARPASARVNVMAADQNLAWFTQTIGGKNVTVDYLASSTEDPHHVEPRPSQVAKLSHADLVVRIGMDLDLWLDSLLRAAANGKVSPGGKGYVDASRGIHVLEIPTGKLDPSKGDIHVFGNPHYIFGPQNMPTVARNITDGLDRVDPANKSTYEANYNELVGRLHEAIQRWQAKMAPDKGKPVVAYHKSLVYLLHEFGLREFGNVEPKPGLEPTPGHISELSGQMKADHVRLILAENFRPRRFSDLLAREAGAKVVAIPGGIGGEKGLNDYFAFMDAIVNRIAGNL